MAKNEAGGRKAAKKQPEEEFADEDELEYEVSSDEEGLGEDDIVTDEEEEFPTGSDQEGDNDGDEEEGEEEDDEELVSEDEEDVKKAIQEYAISLERRIQKGGKTSDGDATEPAQQSEGSDQEHIDETDEEVESSDDDEGGEDDEERRDSWRRASTKPMYADQLHDENDSDTSDDEHHNTVGNVPLEWYKDEEHIGYDREGRRIIKKKKKDALDTLLHGVDSKTAWRTIYDEYNDEEVVLSKEEIKMIKRIREGKMPHAEINPYQPSVDWFEYEDAGVHPLISAPEPKRRFIPSKWEAKKVVKLVRAMRRGWLKLEKEPAKPKVYLLWGDDLQTTERTAVGLQYIAAPKQAPPSHKESYNPSKEYLPTEEEQAAYNAMDEEDKPEFIAKAFDAFRKVPAYDKFVQERFERCLDLYLCPRTKKKRLNIDPETLVPKLPKPQELEPFPKSLCLTYEGHGGKVRTVAVDPSGQWLASGSADKTVRLWEVRTGRCFKTWKFEGSVACVAWCPKGKMRILSAVVGRSVFLFPSGLGTEETQEAAAKTLQLLPEETKPHPACTWARREGSEEGLVLHHKNEVTRLHWHHAGDYFASVSPSAVTTAVLVHQLAKQSTQNPFKKNKGRVVRTMFHPSKPFFFVATQNAIRVYNLAKQALVKKLLSGSGSITSMDVHPSGDHLVLGSVDKRVAWFDMDLSTKPYKVLRHHENAVRSVAFHPSYPLFASASDDGTVHVFHGMVYTDLMQNPRIVPVKILRGHKVVDYEGVVDIAFHPRQPWVFTAGADGNVCLFYNS